jgi:hypothetical protein
VAFVANREEGIRRYRMLLTPAQYRARLAAGDTEGLALGPLQGDPPVLPVRLQRRAEIARDVARFEFAALNGGRCRPSRPARTSMWSSRRSASAPTAWPVTRPTAAATCWARSTSGRAAAARL